MVSLQPWSQNYIFRLKKNLGDAVEEISQHFVLLALFCIQLLSMKEPSPAYMSDIQGKINVFTANLHPLILFLGIIKGFSDTTVHLH